MIHEGREAGFLVPSLDYEEDRIIGQQVRCDDPRAPHPSSTHSFTCPPLSPLHLVTANPLCILADVKIRPDL